jgi:Lactonase, 7-bladed beta-propeller
MDVRLDRDAEQDVRVSYGERSHEPGDCLPRRNLGRAEQHPGASSRGHGPRASERRFVYGANRAQGTAEFQGKQVFKGGENSIVVYAIDQSTGEPRPIQHADTQKIHPRTFHIDPSGRLLVAEHNLPVNVRDGDKVRTVPAGLSMFRVGDDGKLTLVRTCDVEVGDKSMFWMGIVPL